MSNQYYVYILANKYNTVLYIGITRDLIKRVYQHKKNLIKSFTSRYSVHKLVYYEIFQDPENAINREKSLKNLVRRKKDELVNSFNPEWKDLYETLVK